MKRSEINRQLEEAKAFFRETQFFLPPWAYFSPDEWEDKGEAYDEIRNNMLGWDVTDFGFNEFDKTGLLLFTIRNGHIDEPEKKTYAEKIMMAKEHQVTPIHFHYNKMEDIINRNGGVLAIQLWMADEQEGLSDREFDAMFDGVKYTLKGGDTVRLQPGESITLEPYMYHQFWPENGKCLIGEVSKLNDDTNDNKFLNPLGRFPEIEEDEEPIHLLGNEYPR